MGYNLCTVRACATADGSLKREEHRSGRQALTVPRLGWETQAIMLYLKLVKKSWLRWGRWP